MKKTVKQTTTSAKQRLVFGVFGDHQALVRTLSDLATKGFGLEELSLLGSKDMMTAVSEYMQRQPQVNSKLIELTSELDQCAYHLGVVSLVGSTGPVTKLLKQVFSSSAPNNNSTAVPWGESLSQLTARINDGFMILVVSTPKPRQLIHASKILLQRSAHEVQTHEFII